MTPSERIKHIKDIAKALASEDWNLIDLTLKQFDIPTSDTWSENKKSYVIEMAAGASDGTLLELAKHLGIASELQSSTEPTFWRAGDARVFLSHLAKIKAHATDLKAELLRLGITGFVAHEDIEPTTEWQTEIESALATMDGLVALLSPGFNESRWCDQEVGVAIGRKLPVISVRLGLDPYGFIGKYQGVRGTGKDSRQLARELFDHFLSNPQTGPKITAALITMLADAFSFQEAKRIMGLIEESSFVTAKHVSAMKEAVNGNSQVSGAWGVPESVKAIIKRVES